MIPTNLRDGEGPATPRPQSDHPRRLTKVPLMVQLHAQIIELERITRTNRETAKNLEEENSLLTKEIKRLQHRISKLNQYFLNLK